MRHKKVHRVVIFTSLLLSLTVFTPATASVMHCTQKEAKRAEIESSALPNWSALYEAYRNYAHCDDGAVWEGYSESVVRLLVRNFSECEKLCELTNVDNYFEQFVIRHIDDTVPREYLDKIMLNVSTNCPSKAKHLCYMIKTAIES